VCVCVCVCACALTAQHSDHLKVLVWSASYLRLSDCGLHAS
jgi:hypothetical protein